MKKLLAIALAVCMIILSFSITALAGDSSQISRDTVLLLDNSVSMEGDAMTALKAAASNFCEKALAIDGTNRIAIVIYDSDIVSTINFTNNYNTLVNAIKSMDADGSWTNINAAVTKADQLLKTSTAIQKNIIIMSDGLASTGSYNSTGPYSYSDYSYMGNEYYYYQYANALYKNATSLFDSYRIYTLGFYHDLSSSEKVFPSRVMKDIQNAGYYEVTDPDDLDLVFDDISNVIKHNYISEETIPATCTTEGIVTYTCSICDDSYVEVIPALGCYYSATVTAPTCEKDGYTTYVCNRCGYSYVDNETSKLGHNFVNGKCTRCGKSNVMPKIVVSQKTLAITGKQVQVAISLENNPGITSMLLKVSYDTTKLQLESVNDSGKLGTSYHSNVIKSPYTLNWANDTATENITFNGEVVVLTFNVAEDAELGETPITVTYDYDNYDILDVNMQPVEFDVVNGTVEIIDVIIGDVNTDGKINQLDRVMLTRYIANWDGYTEENVNIVAADVNCDGKVNQLDRVILTRHIANWDGYDTLPYTA